MSATVDVISAQPIETKHLLIASLGCKNCSFLGYIKREIEPQFRDPQKERNPRPIEPKREPKCQLKEQRFVVPKPVRVAHCEKFRAEPYLEARHQVATEREPNMPENTNSKQRDNHCLPLWGVIAKVRPTPEHPSYYDWQHGFLVIVLYSDKPDSACAIAKSIIEQLPYELVGAEVAVLDAERLADRCAGAITGGQQLGLGLLLVAFATGSEAAEFETMNFY